MDRIRQTPHLLTTRDVSNITGLSESWLEHDRLAAPGRRRGPPSFKLGRAVRYPAEGVDHWLKEISSNGDGR